ncbi:hypothetical protein B0H15DRAFT_806023 [Mycena belliarum]|uniref:Uncharacterized protein n=1 Tax=Mycena belliarum TaxID=1033014 RepID=A0AAD6TQX3_9AGAR|nr:hypothetical protein B0H15DRAFT_806023 [Mycena belliae]
MAPLSTFEMSPLPSVTSIPSGVLPTATLAAPDPFAGTSPPTDIPDWVGYTGIALFVGILLLQFYSALKWSPKEVPYYETDPEAVLRLEGTRSTPALDAEDLLFRFAVLHTIKEKRDPLPFAAGPLPSVVCRR